MNRTPLWNGFNLITALGARAGGALPQAVFGVSIDTRTLHPGDLYFAIKGENSDGHDYVKAAFEAGAEAAVVDEAHADELKGTGSLFVVRDVLASLESLGRRARERTRAGIVAVTGSVGKTGTKEMLRLVLSEFGETHASAASYNNHWGVPLTLARMPAQSRFGVFEIGMNHAGEITPLVAMVRPHVAVVTTVAPVHLEAFESVDSIADAKAEIFSGLEPNGVAIIHRDIAQFERLRAAAKLTQASQVLSFGEDEKSDARLIAVKNDEDGCVVDAWILGIDLRYRIGAPGKHIALNSLAVLLAGRALGLDVAEIAAALIEFKPPAGRGARSEILTPEGVFTLIDESYNANPASMRAALGLLGAAEPGVEGRRIAVIGDMLELGPNGAKLHAELAADIAANQVDLVFGAGPLTQSLFEALDTGQRAKWATTSAEIRDALLSEVRAGEVVMVKGSNGSRMGPLVKALKDAYAANTVEPIKQD